MKTKTINTYTIDELQEFYPRVYEKVISKFAENDLDYDWREFTVDYWKEQYKDILTWDKTDFDVARGLIELTKVQLICNNLPELHQFMRNWLQENKYYRQKFSPYLNLSKGVIRYFFENASIFMERSGKVQADDNGNPDYDTKAYHYDKHVWSMLLELLTEIVNALQESVLTSLKIGYEYLTSEEAIKENIRINEYDFDEFGRIV